ncbi:MAG: methionyl-tRNA formyltransferase [Planctomycetes bacterium]|nr:methionyl-tRNA formyltransferase [Planctomycetota bacterium]
MRIVFFGSSDFGLCCLDALRDCEYELVKCFTQPAHKAGRGRKPRSTAVAGWADGNGVACVEAENINTADMVQAIADCKADLLVVIAFGQKISDEIINMFELGAINVHGSLLPRWRGAAPVNAAVVAGDSESGITIITVVDKMDAGLMLAKASCAIGPDDTAGSMYKKLGDISPQPLMDVIRQIENGQAVYEEQDVSLVTRAKKMKKADGYIDWSQEAEAINNKVRGYWPWPGVKADYFSGKTNKCYRVTIAKSRVAESAEQTGQYGLLDENLHVICGKGRLEIIELKPAGGRLMNYKDFANGRGLEPGDIFMAIEEAKSLRKKEKGEYPISNTE